MSWIYRISKNYDNYNMFTQIIYVKVNVNIKQKIWFMYSNVLTSGFENMI